MPYDLYGNSYKTAKEAELAEMAQVAEIDSRINAQQLRNIERKSHEDYHMICMMVDDLQKRVAQLEAKLNEKS